ncbi:related to peptide transporter [Phialocephala subalpina]|uniref:Related to peptide transporter n=1 Tax=Phialocephala subalpina TaxID=576137 RepID=A0A1L7WHM7_9HELO|nr:related to peptide transporter [Phialocephala subalpina]
MERPTFTHEGDDVLPDEKVAATPVRTNSGSKEKEGLGEKGALDYSNELPHYHDEEGRDDGQIHLDTAEDLVTQIIHVDDDPTLNPWTFRTFFIGLGLSCFGSIIYVSIMFLTLIAYAAGELMAYGIPRWGLIGRFLNPGPFNMKEHAAIVIMASAASVSATSTLAIAAQRMYYGGYPNKGAAIFVTISSQLVGYGLAGMMRGTLLWPTKMLYPANLPITTVLETLHKDRAGNQKRMKVFWIIFACLFFWTIVPEYIFPLLIGVSIFCLADQHSLVFTNLFGGAMGNEGTGLLSICLDWNYIAGFGSPLWLPLQTLTNSLIGTIGCVIIYMGIYYHNTWRAMDFPFLSQQLYNSDSNFTFYDIYNQTLILNPDQTINDTLVDTNGIPWLAGTYVVSLITNNAGFTANFVHMFLWNYLDIKAGWSFFNLATLKSALTPSNYFFWKDTGKRTEEEKEALKDNPDIDPHYKAMVSYDEAPDSWYFYAFAASFICAMVSLYVLNSTLPWWGLIFAMIVLWIYMLFFGAQYAITGFQFNLQSVSQTMAGYCFPRAPLANMYFVIYTFNAVQQGQYLLRDLKLAQQVKLSPKATFTTQMLGCIFGAILNFIMMESIVTNQLPTLLSIEGTSIWSGVNIQSLNSAAITWAMAPKLFSIGARYQWVSISYFIGFLVPLPFYFMNKFFPQQKIWSYLNLSIILWYFGYLVVGINSSVWIYFVIGYFGQFYLRKYRPQQFIKWNYLVSAALDGGTQVMVFILSFAVAGASGVDHPFPAWWGNYVNGNVDYCMYNPANG